MRVGKWPGGYIRRTKAGADVYVLERWVRGVHFHASTRCNSLRAAMKHLERFEASPQQYLREEKRLVEGLQLTDDLVKRWAAHAKRQGLSEKYIGETQRFLADWAEALDGEDLRRLTLATLQSALRTRKQRPHRIIAVKTFFSWLRTAEGLLRHEDDATLDLPVPQASPEKQLRRKIASQANVMKVFPFLDFREAAVLQLLCATAWHVEEVRRFAMGGELAAGVGDVLAVAQVRHKSGELTRTPLKHPVHVFAAESVRVGGRLPEARWLNRALHFGCDAAGVPHFQLGHMRHTVLTWAKDAGASMADLAEFAGHKSPVTTRRFYVDQAVPTVAVPTVVLQ